MDNLTLYSDPLVAYFYRLHDGRGSPACTCEFRGLNKPQASSGARAGPCPAMRWDKALQLSENRLSVSHSSCSLSAHAFVYAHENQFVDLTSEP